MLYAVSRRQAKRKTIFPFPDRSQPQQDGKSRGHGSQSTFQKSDKDTRTKIEDDINPTMGTRALPPWITSSPIEEDFQTESSYLQQETADECLPLLTAFSPVSNDFGLPSLAREKHIRFLRRALGRLPGGFSSLDASKPWMLYWALNGLALLGEDMTQFRHRSVCLHAAYGPRGG